MKKSEPREQNEPREADDEPTQAATPASGAPQTAAEPPGTTISKVVDAAPMYSDDDDHQDLPAPPPLPPMGRIARLAALRASSPNPILPPVNSSPVQTLPRDIPPPANISNLLFPAGPPPAAGPANAAAFQGPVLVPETPVEVRPLFEANPRSQPEPEPEPDIEESSDTDDLYDDSKSTLQRAEPGLSRQHAKLGVVGGTGTGKSFLFQSMVYRAHDVKRSGALAYYLKDGHVNLYETLDRNLAPRALNTNKFLRSYEQWMRPAQTKRETQQWYTMRVSYRTGLLGRARAELDVEYLDGAGEVLAIPLTNDNKDLIEIWEHSFLFAQTMVFCLPMWVPFPDRAVMTEQDWIDRDNQLTQFYEIVNNFRFVRERRKVRHSVQVILGLTMADDKRTALTAVRDKWIDPFVRDEDEYRRLLQKGAGISRYLANAQLVSQALHTAFDQLKDGNRVTGIPSHLKNNFGRGEPWMLPMSAVDGAKLETINQRYGAKDRAALTDKPTPVHVELPLLVALCDAQNALM